ncbi:MAG TPA: pyridoxamine 5'-phosphate oxidase family protein [Vicinamibacterales bacterium]|nr:pyridoxamine 5'-phosphate oxidase family protein [Vicinamibacterales bacterium]
MSSSLRECYPEPSERAVLKTQRALDVHMKRFVALSPFVCLGSSSEDGADVTPRGDQPGFVHVLDDATLLIPDWPGNNRLDTLMNIEANPQVGLLFLIPGFNESLRVNGTAEVSLDPSLIERWTVNGKHPRSVVRVTVREAFLHCGKAIIRSKLWDESSRVDRSALPPYGQMLKDEIDVRDSAEEIQASVEDAYRTRLY